MAKRKKRRKILGLDSDHDGADVDVRVEDLDSKSFEVEFDEKATGPSGMVEMGEENVRVDELLQDVGQKGGFTIEMGGYEQEVDVRPSKRRRGVEVEFGDGTDLSRIM